MSSWTFFSSSTPYTLEEEAYQPFQNSVPVQLLKHGQEKASKLIVLPNIGFKSKLGSLDIHAK